MFNKKSSYLYSTLKFCIAGIFIPAVTIYAIVVFQIGLEFLGIECKTAWTIIWTITSIGAIVTPAVFILLLSKTSPTNYKFKRDNIVKFNIIELLLIQTTLAIFFTTGQSLCYGNGGQNGLEFIFTGWMALPALLIFSLIFDVIQIFRIRRIIINKY